MTEEHDNDVTTPGTSPATPPVPPATPATPATPPTSAVTPATPPVTPVTPPVTPVTPVTPPAPAGDDFTARREAWERERRREGGAADRDPLGSVAGEARRLLEVLQDRAAREVGRGVIRGTAAGLGHLFGGVTARPEPRDVWEEAVAEQHGDGYICRACPVCRVLAARRDAGGGVTDHLVVAGGELVSALREAVDALTRPPAPRSPRDDRPDVEHIDLG